MSSGASVCDVRLDNVSKEYVSDGRSLVALKDVTLAIEARKLVVIVGPSGCGKTTLLRIIAGLETASSGMVWTNPERTSHKTTYVHQFPRLLPWRTLLQNISIGIEISAAIEPGHVAHIRGLINEFGLRGFESSFPEQLSGGMQQRAALIRAIAARPSLMLCDEPFSAIDFVNRLTLSTAFKRQCSVEGITTVLVTHNIEEAIFLGDVIHVLSHRPGRIKATYKPKFPGGRPDAVACRRTPEFEQLFQSIWKDLEV